MAATGTEDSKEGVEMIISNPAYEHEPDGAHKDVQPAPAPPAPATAPENFTPFRPRNRLHDGIIVRAKWVAVAYVIGLLLIALTVGLAVGLGTKRHKNEGNNGGDNGGGGGGGPGGQSEGGVTTEPGACPDSLKACVKSCGSEEGTLGSFTLEPLQQSPYAAVELLLKDRGLAPSGSPEDYNACCVACRAAQGCYFFAHIRASNTCAFYGNDACTDSSPFQESTGGARGSEPLVGRTGGCS